MSLRHTSGTSLVEVMVMMVILGISLVGIFSLVDSGQKLATLSDIRLNAINIAREGLESVTTLRDTFDLNGYESGTCTGPIDAFFSTDGHILLDTNCPTVTSTETPYILTDAKTLDKKDPQANPNYNVCINEFGWYSQEQSMSSGATVENCTSPVEGKCTCANTITLCSGNITQSCKTRFQRRITFTQDADGCGSYSAGYCIHAYSTVWWGASPSEVDTSVTLDQIITTID